MGLKRIDLYRLSHLFLPLPFFLIPFLGGNHLSLYYVTIDKFWIESTFVLFLVFAVLFQSRNKNLFTGKTVLYFFIPFAIINLISVFYTWNIFSTMNEMNTLIWIAGSVYIFINAKKRDVFLYALVLGTVLSAICAIAQSKFLFPGLVETFKGGTHADMVRAQAIPFSSFFAQENSNIEATNIIMYFFIFIRRVVYRLFLYKVFSLAMCLRCNPKIPNFQNSSAPAKIESLSL